MLTILFTTIILAFSFADDYTRWELPEGAMLRLGKGKLRDIGGKDRLLFSPDSSQLIVFTSIGVWVYNAETGEEIRLITCSMDCNPFNFVISPNFQTIACQTDSWEISKIKLYDFQTGQHIKILDGPVKRINSIDFSPNSQMLVGVDFDDKMFIWDISSGKHRIIHTPHNIVSKVQFSPNGQSLMSSTRGEYHIWDANTGELNFVLKDTDGTEKIVYGPGGNLLVGTNDMWIRIWDAETGLIKITLNTKMQSQRPMVAFSPDGKTLANANRNKIELWDLQTQQQKGILKGKPEHVKPVHEGDDDWYFQISHNLVNSMKFSPDGHTLAISTKNEIQFWDLVAGKYKLKFRSKGSFGELTFSPDGRTLAARGDRWDNETGSCLFNIDNDVFQNSNLRCFITGHRPEVRSVAFSQEGHTIASGYRNGYIRIWDVSTGKLKQVLKGNPYPLWVQSITISPDGNTLACLNTNTQSSGGYSQVLLWNLTNGVYLRTLKGHGKNIGKYITNHPNSIAFSPDGKVIVSGSLDGTVRLWNNKAIPNNSSNNKLRGVFSDWRKGTLKGHTDQVLSVAISPDGQTIASGSKDKTVRLWDLTTQELINSLDKHPSGVQCVVFSPDGETLASSDENGTVYLWDFIAGERKGVFTDDDNQTTSVISLAYSPDGKKLAGGGNSIYMWDVDSHQLNSILTGHRGYVNSVKFSPDGCTLASGSSDGTVLLWNISDQ